jgi:TPR repeat protein
MFAKHLLLLLTLICLAATPAVATALDSRANVERAIELIEAGEMSLARSYLQPALLDWRLHASERSRAYYLRGYSYFVQRMYTSAANDYGRALEFNAENPAVLAAVGGMYFNGLGRKRNYEAAYGFFERAAELGHVGALIQMGHAQMMGLGVEKDLIKARELLTQAAGEDTGDGSDPAQRNAAAMFQLASSYRAEVTDEPNPQLAAEWFRKAHEAGSADALVALAFMYQAGEMGEADPDTAIALFKEAAEAGSGTAQVSAKAREWFEKGAHADAYEAQIRLAYMLLREDVDHASARRWLARAVAHGHPRAHNDYAWMLATSKHAELRDGALALRHARQAVDGEPSPGHLDTLAAAYAELEQFDQAIDVQKRALALVEPEQPELLEELTKRLSAYEQSQPWRE